MINEEAAPAPLPHPRPFSTDFTHCVRSFGQWLFLLICDMGGSGKPKQLIPWTIHLRRLILFPRQVVDFI
ncbi:hypothetical protein [Consotaella salsifontis]|uniref:hypothetical protein n=1 Tax=Consotaella salsifontis TaxID=1365950 RepID=UPI00105485E1|nr:hypothetical protein [Consotaella salsifontis]